MENGTFISQSKYCKEVLKKFGMDTAKEASTSMGTSCYLDKYESGIEVNQTMYRGIIDSLLYLTTSRPDIMQFVCVCSFSSQSKRITSYYCKKNFKILKKELLVLDFGILQEHPLV